MKVLVPVKRVIDYNVKVRVKSDGSGVDLANVKMSMTPLTKSPSKRPSASGKPARPKRSWPSRSV